MTTQLERLQQDIRELEQYIVKLNHNGKDNLVKKMERKMDYLQKHYTGKRSRNAA
jgi:hypothetical protein